MVRAFEIILQKGEIGETYNIGGNSEISVNRLAELLSILYGKEIDRVYVGDRCFNDLRYAIDSTKLNSLGWKTEVELTEGLKITSIYSIDC